eukprot:14642916-Alexandrium_andersonii.AAC.1
MAEVAKGDALRNIAKHGDVTHAELKETANNATRNIGIQNMVQKRTTTGPETRHFDSSQDDDEEMPH